jgi:RNA polymerase sigma-70 factor, ECF subfamily
MTEQDFRQHIIVLSRDVYPMARRLLGSEELARDAIQQSMMKLWENRHKLFQYDNKRAFVFKVVRNVCLDELKRKKPILSDGDIYENLQIVNPELTQDRKEIFIFINECISTLSENQRDVIQMRDIDGLEFEEISEILGMEVQYIRVLLSRARKAVKEQLMKIYAYGTK